MSFTPPENSRVAIIGLGYVGLPLAVEFAKKLPVVGFDINVSRVEQLRNGQDLTLEVDNADLLAVQEKSDDGFGLKVTNLIEDLAHSNFYIVTVPTPVDKHHRPDLNPLFRASETIAKVIKQGDVVIYESTVYPGVTEDECVPIIEKVSGLKFNVDFFAGYSPERINPGDKEHTVTKILKVTSGSTPEVAKYVDEIYAKVITAGTYSAASIKVAEAAKVIENSQRDINIAFVNELSIIFNKLGIDTQEVLKAAGTKWNFLPFKPGLVGGHCIGVDPYYLAQKAEEVGYHPEIILSGRRLNDRMGAYVAGEVVKLLVQRDVKVKGAKVLVLGITFKENCPDIRNTKVIDVIAELQSFGTVVEICDPWADPSEVNHEYGLKSKKELPEDLSTYDAVVLTVGHGAFKKLSAQFQEDQIIYDVKSFFDPTIVTARL